MPENLSSIIIIVLFLGVGALAAIRLLTKRVAPVRTVAAVVADKMLLYKKASGKVLAGLLRRRQAERKLFLTPVVTAKKSSLEIAREVIAGKWGNGATRKKKLEAAGYDYKEIQDKVNWLLG